jgi:hypothetical protein
MSEKL